MSGVLVVAEHLQGQVREVTRELVTAAGGLGGPVTVALIADDPSRLVDQVRVAGVDEVVTVPVGPEEFEADPYRVALEAVLAERRPDAVLLGFTVNSMGYGPAVAARLGLGFASDVFALAREDDAILATRAFYGSKVHATLEFPSTPVMLLLRPTTWPAAEGTSQPTVSSLDAPAAPSRSRHLAYEAAPTVEVDITTAEFLVSIGRGIGERDNIEIFEKLAEKLGATLSASRPLVDAGWLPAWRQVGQSGRTVKPRVYLAFGISGAVQHLAGMKQAGTIIAVNTDPDAAIFSVAHYGAVADLFDVADELDRRW